MPTPSRAMHSMARSRREVAAHFLRTLGGVLDIHTGPQQHGVHSCLAEVVALVAVHAAGNRGAVFQQVVHRPPVLRCPMVAPLADILRGIHARLTAQAVMSLTRWRSVATAWRAASVGSVPCWPLSLPIPRAPPVGSSPPWPSAPWAGLLPAASIWRLQVVKRCFFLCRQVTASGAGAAHNSLADGRSFPEWSWLFCLLNDKDFC